MADPHLARPLGIHQARRPRDYLLAAAASAVLLALCYPPPAWGKLAYVALVPVTLITVRASSIWHLLWTTYVVFTVWWLVMLRWLIPVTGLGYVLLSAFMACYAPLTMLMVLLLVRRWKIPALLALPMAWVTFEFIRGVWPAGGFAWFSLGHSQAPHETDTSVSRVIQIADVAGQYAVSFVVAMSNGLIVDVLTMPWVVSRHGRRSINRRRITAIGLGLVVMAGAQGYGAYRIRQVPGRAPRMSIVVIQTDVPQSNKITSSRQELEKDWQKLLELTRRSCAQAPKPALVVWPETVVPGPLNSSALGAWKASQDEPDQWITKFHGEIQQLCQQLQVHLLVGASTLQYDTRNRYNSVYLYDPNGRQAHDQYDKIHRVPFGEYLPWVEHVPWLRKILGLISPHDFDYTLTAGSRRTVFEVPPGSDEGPGEPGEGKSRLVTPICFEDTVSRVCRRLIYARDGVKRADVIVNLTNDAWYYWQQRPQHLQIAVFRSIENRTPTARSVNRGVSGFISSTGLVGPTLSGRSGADFLKHDVQLDDRRTLYGRIGNGPIAAVAVSSFLLASTALIRRKQK